ncbi:MAG: peptidase [Proteobacteria bacterium]|nr:peptidase [Pseudomonadota bacterium]MCZ6894372.1 peptidase [Gammaproteobacteria bacterium]
MTYCLAMKVDAGLVFIADSRTNAGVDQISTYSKMHRFGFDGQRQFCLLTAGNLATSQAIVTQVKFDIDQALPISLASVTTLAEATEYVGQVSIMQQQKAGGGPEFEASIIFGGQIAGSAPELVLIYPQGNHIATSDTTPFFQIGESKYGKPILDRIITRDSALHTTVLCGLVSMDSTMRSNVTVGPPLEILVYTADSLTMNEHITLNEDSDYLRELKRSWDEHLKEAFRQLPPPEWAGMWDHPDDEASGQA